MSGSVMRSLCWWIFHSRVRWLRPADTWMVVSMAAVVLLLQAFCALASTYYVDAARADDAGDGLSWATAKYTIQAAVDLAQNGDTVLVTDGIYEEGGKQTPLGLSTNRVCITRAITLRSVNGPDATFIVGYAGSGGSNNADAVRCVFMATNSVLDGFTLTNGCTMNRAWQDNNDYDNYGGGANCTLGGMLTNCVLTGNKTYEYGGGAINGTLNNCIIRGNTAEFGGAGCSQSILNECELIENEARYSGGGSYFCTLNTCILRGNVSLQSGGGAYYSTLYNCTLTGNTSVNGGGSDHSTMSNCTVTGNSATLNGGGIYNGVLNNCRVTGNRANKGGGACLTTIRYGASAGRLYNCLVSSNTAVIGGGVYGRSPDFPTDGAIYNCTVVGNVATEDAGGMFASHSWNSVVWGNQCISNQNHANFNTNAGYYVNNCTMPLPTNGTNNVASDPRFMDASGGDYTLLPGSPCVDAGNNTYAPTNSSPYDLAGNARIVNGTVDMGAYESNPQTLYADASRPDNSGDGLSWATAKRTIQAAVDLARNGDTVLVAAGSYNEGSVQTPGGLSLNRVCITNIITLRSESGADETFIVGTPGSNGSNDLDAVRCIYMATNSVVEGFTLKQGYTMGHVYVSGYPDSRWYTDETGGGVWCRNGGTVNHCIFTENYADYYGGGVMGGTLNNCILNSNVAKRAGGAWVSTLNHCVLTGNKAYYVPDGSGGGAQASTLNDCMLSYNTAVDGGGAYNCTLNGCTVTQNAATRNGGGASFNSRLNDCVVSFNTAGYDGGGVDGYSLSNCTVIGNTAGRYGGGTYSCSLFNCIVRENSAVEDGGGAYMVDSNSGQTPEPSVADTAISCQFINNTAKKGAGVYGSFDDARFGGHSITFIWAGILTDCTLSGNVASESGGGCYGGKLNNCELLNNAALYGGGVATGIVNNCTISSNTACMGGGAYQGTLTNCMLIENMATQDGGGVYQGRLTGCTLTGNTATNGGGSAASILNNCTLCNNSAVSGGGAFDGTLTHCALTENSATYGGGGFYNGYFGVLNHCVLSSNTAPRGGGASGGDLNHCLLIGNTADIGGGSQYARLYNCIVRGNTAASGGGSASSWLKNCTLVGNTASAEGGGTLDGSAVNSIIWGNACFDTNNPISNYVGGTFSNSCTLPLPAAGSGNMEQDPQFANAADGDYHLLDNSPCINAGNNELATNAMSYDFSGDTTNAPFYDYDVNPRIVCGIVDMGAYEFQGVSSLCPAAFNQQYGQPLNGSHDHLDMDSDGLSNWQEWLAGTDPTNRQSCFRVTTEPLENGAGLVVRWNSKPGRLYNVYRCTNLNASPAFSIIQANIQGQAGVTSYTDTEQLDASFRLYKIKVKVK